MLRTTSHLARGDAGAALVETALIAPLLLAVMLGAVDAAGYAKLAIEVTNSARAGAAYGAVDIANAQSTSGIAAAATVDMPNVGSVTSTTFCTYADGSPDPTCAVSANTNHRIIYVQVNTTITATPIIDFSAGGILPIPASLKTFSASAFQIMRVSEQ